MQTEENFDRFVKKHLITSDRIYTSNEELVWYCQQYDAYVVGSDLVWNPDAAEGINPIYYLEFANHKRKVAYAPSIGTLDLSDDQLKAIAAKASGLDWVSVREQTSAEQLQPYMDKRVYGVLDPTLLTYAEDWEEFYNQKPLYKRKYIFAFALEKSKVLIKQVNLLAEQYNCDIVVYGANIGYQAKRIKCVVNKCGPAEFLNYIKFAHTVVSNSFHGCAFSVIFNKELYCIPHSTRGVRMTDLLRSLQMEDHIITMKNAIVTATDYNQVEVIREGLIKSSLNYLKNALSED